jgi:ABC-type antimicrobial peptide transport system permease subunit
MAILVRGLGDADGLRPPVAAAVEAAERNAPFRLLPLATAMAGMAWVFGAFSATASLVGILGLLLAFSGTYSVVAFLVAQRTREFGIRLALGATVGRIVTAIVRDMLRTASVGLAAGVALAFAISTVVSGNIPIISPFGPLAYTIGATVVLTATIAAALLPSIRTARIDPSSALRVD